MFRILEIEDTVRVPPAKFAKPKEKAVLESLREQYEGMVDPDIGVVLNVESVDFIGEGKIIPGNGAAHYLVRFKLLVFWPELHEVILGEVVDITEVGAFVRIGPLDGLVHVSQVMDDYVSYDKKNRVLSGRESKRVLREGDVVLARIISVSWTKEHKVGMTMRQPGLGSLRWIQEDKEGVKKKVEKKEKKEKVKKKG